MTRVSATNKRTQKEQSSQVYTNDDQDRSLKKAFGILHQIDPKQKGRMTCTVWVQSSDGGRRLWGNGQEIVIVNSPLDLLLRFGGLKSGMIVELTWRGISETGNPQAYIIGEPEETKSIQGGEQIPRRNIDTQSSVPFEPMGV